jgi:predicted ArsR family transcriptional regulator
MMGRERDEETGKFTTQYQREDFLNALEEGDFLATSDVAEVVGCTQNLAYRRLKELENEGKVKSKEIGRFLAWQKAD